MDDTVAPQGLVGQLLGDRYRLVRLVSAGASVDVFEAEDERLPRRVAVRLDHTDAATHVTPLDNPDLARVLDGGEHHGARYVVMELVDGPTQVVGRPSDHTSVMPVALTPAPQRAPENEAAVPVPRVPWSRRAVLGIVVGMILLVVALAVAADDGDLEAPPSTVPVSAEPPTTVAPTTTTPPTTEAPPEEERGKGKGHGKGSDADDG